MRKSRISQRHPIYQNAALCDIRLLAPIPQRHKMLIKPHQLAAHSPWVFRHEKQPARVGHKMTGADYTTDALTRLESVITS